MVEGGATVIVATPFACVAVGAEGATGAPVVRLTDALFGENAEGPEALDATAANVNCPIGRPVMEHDPPTSLPRDCEAEMTHVRPDNARFDESNAWTV